MNALPVETVRTVLGRGDPIAPDYLSLLRVPFYLNIASSLPEPLLARTETDLLHALRDTYSQPVPTGVPGPRSLEPALDELAALQLGLMTYEVPFDDYVAMSGAELVGQLEQRGALVRRTAGMTSVVRLNHDLLDAFGIVTLLLEPVEGRVRRERLYADAADDLGSPLLSMLVQVAHDTGEHRLLREVFTAILRMLDRKRFDDAWMGRSWTATYVLRDKFTIVAPLILECLGGEPAASLDPGAESEASRLAPDPRVTQEAASSLASAFIDLDDWQLPDPDRAVAILAAGLGRWHLRKRFVEALGRYRRRDALEALSAFARHELTDGGDLSVMGEVADAIGRLGESLGSDEREHAAEVLGAIASHAQVDKRAERIAISRRNRLAARYYSPIPPIEEAEIVHNLAPLAERGGYSDWRVVRQYAEHALDRLLRGQGSPELTEALLAAFVHQHTFVRISVARCLARIDDASCREALFEEILKPTLAADVRKACLEAIERQIDDAPSAQLRAARRWQTLVVARRLAGLSTGTAEALRGLARNAQDDLVVTEGAMELPPVLSAARAASAPVTVAIELDTTGVVTVDAAAVRLIDAEDVDAVGRGWERKFCVVSVTQVLPDHLVLRLVETTWEEAAAFHRAVRRKYARIPDVVDRMLESRLRGIAVQPGIASVHTVVLTRDGRVVLARRSTDTHYAPGLWSTSFEEQLTGSDLDDGPDSVLHNVVRRGLREEFGYADDVEVRYLSTVLEMPILNPSIVALARLGQDETSFVQDSRSAVDADGSENTEIRFIDAGPDALHREAATASLHPTSAIRLHLLARFLKGAGPGR